MKKFLMKLWKEEEGAETAEWLIIVALIAAVGVAVYTNTLEGGLSQAATDLAGFVQTIISNAQL
jgi:Flp pilus assembly pilin Flp